MHHQLAGEALDRIEKTLRIPNSPMYRERLPRADLPYATLCPLSMYRCTLITAAERDPTRYLPKLQRHQSRKSKNTW